MRTFGCHSVGHGVQRVADGARATRCVGSRISWGPPRRFGDGSRTRVSKPSGGLLTPMYNVSIRDTYSFSRTHPSVLLRVIAWKRACIGGMTLRRTKQARSRGSSLAVIDVNGMSFNVLVLCRIWLFRLERWLCCVKVSPHRRVIVCCCGETTRQQCIGCGGIGWVKSRGPER